MSRLLHITVTAVLCVALSGCAMTWHEPPGCAVIGGAVGAVGGTAGGVVHADGDDDWEGALIALGSTVAGAGIGYTVCHLLEDEPAPQAARAPASVPAEPVQVAEPEPEPIVVVAAPVAPPAPDPCAVAVELEGVNFDSNRAEIRPDAGAILDGAVASLRACTDRRVRVEAYTDSSGSDAYNQALSQRRADAVRQYLVGAGIAADRVDAVGMGEADPVASNATKQGRARNRRVELKPIE